MYRFQVSHTQIHPCLHQLSYLKKLYTDDSENKLLLQVNRQQWRNPQIPVLVILNKISSQPSTYHLQILPHSEGGAELECIQWLENLVWFLTRQDSGRSHFWSSCWLYRPYVGALLGRPGFVLPKSTSFLGCNFFMCKIVFNGFPTSEMSEKIQ